MSEERCETRNAGTDAYTATYWQMQYTCRCGAVSTMERPTEPIQCEVCGNRLEAQ